MHGGTRSLLSPVSFTGTTTFLILVSAGAGALCTLLLLWAVCACVACRRRRRTNRERNVQEDPDAGQWSNPLHEPVREDIRNRLLDEITPRNSPRSPGPFFITPGRFSSPSRGFPQGGSLSREGVASLMLRAVELLREPNSPAYARVNTSERHRSPLGFGAAGEEQSIPLECMSSRSVAVQALAPETQNSEIDEAVDGASVQQKVDDSDNESGFVSVAYEVLECMDSATEASGDEARQGLLEEDLSTPRFVFQAASEAPTQDVKSNEAPEKKDSDTFQVQSVLDSLIAKALSEEPSTLEERSEFCARKQAIEGDQSSVPGTSTTDAALDREKSPEVVAHESTQGLLSPVCRINSAFDNPFFDQTMTPSPSPKLPESVKALTPTIPARHREAVFNSGGKDKSEGSETRSAERWESALVVDESPLDMPVVVEEFAWRPDDIENENTIEESGSLYEQEIHETSLDALRSSNGSDPIFVESIDEIIIPSKRKSPGSTAISPQLYAELESDGERSVNQAVQLDALHDLAPQRHRTFLSPIPPNERWPGKYRQDPAPIQKHTIPNLHSTTPTTASTPSLAPSLGKKKKTNDILRLNGNDSEEEDDGLPLQFGKLEEGVAGSSLLFPISPQSTVISGDGDVLKDSPEKNRGWSEASHQTVRRSANRGVSRMLDFDQPMYPTKENVEPETGDDVTGFDTDSSSSSLGDFKKFLGKKDEIVPNVLRGYVFPLDSPQISSATSSVHRAASIRESRPRRKTSPAPRKNSNPGGRRPMSPGYATQAPQIDLSNHPFGQKHSIPNIAREPEPQGYVYRPNALDGWIPAGKFETIQDRYSAPFAPA
ncbi:hypothetical protein BSKO_12434 [Bryopsis sp. KO-2023]|nr:hypothetical protein BSKO_12434 [Bryopsis sp. KO-2023]